ncbi:hypothetical protein QWI17_22865 [Gilvimarinus sp. SDUM040013]|uniref:Uncharacterized protein n=1 Tax=Gilvimarinus gilvus TaxID=3058038 RepID=A0ABU4RZF0_9GAMM|nr:hypothetical protein [Gilvimarinus sp. SDUM040013]MDO3388707.1 hypothetical protein [Gilvimarinus sp. SDUM040013]MDX6849602.1 hypothetical protein [Gilvimarinus sp. SDUM040013]
MNPRPLLPMLCQALLLLAFSSHQLRAQEASGSSVSHYIPAPAEQARADQTFHQFTQLLRQADYPGAYQYLDTSLQRRQTATQWQTSELRFAESAGTHAGYSTPTATWFFDPPHASKPGIYVQYRYKCHYAYLDPCHETLALFSALGETFTVIRHSRSYINTRSGKRTGSFVEIPGHHSRIR